MAAELLASVVMVSHNSGATLADAVHAVLAQDASLEIVLVDNASSDGSVERLSSDPRLSIERNGDNRGFARACNQGARRTRGARLLFLNPDCLLPPGALQRLCLHLDADPRIGVLGAQLLDPDGSPQAASRRRTPTPQRALRHALGWGRDAVEIVRTENATRVEDVDAVSGALMLMPRTAFDALAGFDEGYVLHCEDLDLCRRVQQQGMRVALANDVHATHVKGTSSRRRPVWVEWQKHRGMRRYFDKFDAAQAPLWMRLAVPLAIWARFPLAALRALWRARQR
jgi:N-acetylglucosaminyl-diphospho-decaprenol L-rhamnosyltransferase